MFPTRSGTGVRTGARFADQLLVTMQDKKQVT